MTVAVPLNKAARTLGELVNQLHKNHTETVLTKNGKPVAKLVAIPTPPAAGRQAEFEKQMAEWYANTTEEDREAFARDIERGREVVEQTIPRSWD